MTHDAPSILEAASLLIARENRDDPAHLPREFGDALIQVAAGAFEYQRTYLRRVVDMSFDDAARLLMIARHARPEYMADALVLALLAELQAARAASSIAAERHASRLEALVSEHLGGFTNREHAAVLRGFAADMRTGALAA